MKLVNGKLNGKKIVWEAQKPFDEIINATDRNLWRQTRGALPSSHKATPDTVELLDEKDCKIDCNFSWPTNRVLDKRLKYFSIQTSLSARLPRPYFLPQTPSFEYSIFAVTPQL